MKRQELTQFLFKKCSRCGSMCQHLSSQNRVCANCLTFHQNTVIEPTSNPTSIIHELQDIMHSHNNLKLDKSYSFEQEQHIDTDEIIDLNQSKDRSYIHNDSREVHYDLQEQQQNESDQQNRKVQEQRLLQSIRQNKHNLKADQKVVVGTGFTFDMTDFFKFSKKEEMKAGQKQGTFLQEISGSRIAWLILLYTVISSAMIPGWIMNIKATKLLRQSWRFLMQALMVIPFLLHQKRTGNEQTKQKYTLRYIFNMNNLIKPYISSLSSSLWFLLILSSFEWTYVAHGIVLGSLSNFFLSIGRSFRRASHDLQSGGQMLVVLGIFFVVYDSYSLKTDNIADEEYININTFYLSRTWWQRLGGDIVAILTSLMMSQFSKYTSDLRSYYPPFLSMLLVNSFNFLNIGLICFFFNGATFDFDPYWGIFSIFTDQHFVSFMYMAIVLAFGQMVSVLMITRMFPDPIIPALAMTLEPFMACLIVHLANIQNLPGDFAMIGFIFIFPGLLVVLMGQCFFQRQKSYTQQSNLRVQKLLDEIQQLKEVNKKKTIKLIPTADMKEHLHSKLYKSTINCLTRKNTVA